MYIKDLMKYLEHFIDGEKGNAINHAKIYMKSEGYYEAVWNASSHASGMYFIRMNVYNSEHRLQFSKMQKIILVK